MSTVILLHFRAKQTVILLQCFLWRRPRRLPEFCLNAPFAAQKASDVSEGRAIWGSLTATVILLQLLVATLWFCCTSAVKLLGQDCETVALPL